MLYRVSLIVNTVLCIALLMLAFYALTIEKDFSDLSLSIVLIIFLMCGVFLWQHMLCRNLATYNKEHIPVPKNFKTTGKIVFILTVLDVLAVLLFTIVAIAEAVSAGSRGSELKVAPLLFSFILFFLLGASGIVNLIGYQKALKKNEASVNDLINKIGA